MSSEKFREITEALAAPFPSDRLGWKAQATKENRALAVAYIDARDVMDRLDEVVGAGGWQDSYDVLPSGEVVCRLALRVGEDWITKTDVGGESEQKDHGDKVKAAFSDALKRAAVKWGVGRYLYRLEGGWVDYDPQKKQLLKTPQLPAWALPKGGKPADLPKGDAYEGPQAAALDPRQRDDITRLVRECGFSDRQLLATLKKDHGKEQVSALTYDEAAALIAKLEQYHKRLPREHASARQPLAPATAGKG